MSKGIIIPPKNMDSQMKYTGKENRMPIILIIFCTGKEIIYIGKVYFPRNMHTGCITFSKSNDRKIIKVDDIKQKHSQKIDVFSSRNRSPPPDCHGKKCKSKFAGSNFFRDWHFSDYYPQKQPYSIIDTIINTQKICNFGNQL